MSDFRFPPPDSEGWWKGRPYDDAAAPSTWYRVHREPRFNALVVTIKGRNGRDEDIPVQVVPCVWAGPFPREDVS